MISVPGCSVYGKAATGSHIAIIQAGLDLQGCHNQCKVTPLCSFAFYGQTGSPWEGECHFKDNFNNPILHLHGTSTIVPCRGTFAYKGVINEVDQTLGANSMRL